MLHEYRKKTAIKAEQFDGSTKQIARYKVHIVGPTSTRAIGLPQVLMANIGPLPMTSSVGHMRGATDGYNNVLNRFADCSVLGIVLSCSELG